MDSYPERQGFLEMGFLPPDLELNKYLTPNIIFDVEMLKIILIYRGSYTSDHFI